MNCICQGNQIIFWRIYREHAGLHGDARRGGIGLAAKPVVQVERHRLVEVPEVDHPRLLHGGAVVELRRSTLIFKR